MSDIAPTGPAFAGAPTIETDRLILRAHKLDDYTFYHEMWSDPGVVRFIGKPRQAEETWLKFLRSAGHWTLLGYGYWIVVEKGARVPIGEVGFNEFRRDMRPSIKGEPEMGWAFAAHAHGKGFASEATQAAIDWADENLPCKRLSCIINPENGASVKIAEKMGFVRTENTKYHGADIILFHRAWRHACK